MTTRNKIARAYMSLAIKMFGRPARQKPKPKSKLKPYEHSQKSTILVDILLVVLIIVGILIALYIDNQIQLEQTQAFEVEHIHNTVGAQR